MPPRLRRLVSLRRAIAPNETLVFVVDLVSIE
jgi:hypothetical protein